MTDKEMLQVQHVQIAGGTNSAEDVCADTKKAVTIRLQDALTGALIGLARAIDDPALASAETWTIMTEGLMATAPDAHLDDATTATDVHSDDAATTPDVCPDDVTTAPDVCLDDVATATDVYSDGAAIEALIRKVRAEKERLAPGCSQCMAPCGRTADYDMQALWSAEEEVRALKLRILADLREIAAHIAHAPAQQDEENDVYPLLSEALFKIGYDESKEALMTTVRKVEEMKPVLADRKLLGKRHCWC